MTARDLAPLFGDHPTALLREIRRAATVQELRQLNQRSRAFALEFLTSAASADWLARLTHVIDVAIVTRVVALTGGERMPGCWCFCGSSGRAESLTKLAPHLLVILGDDDEQELAQGTFHRVLDSWGMRLSSATRLAT